MISFLFFICIAIGSSFSAGEGNKASLNFNEIFNNEIKDMKEYLESESEKIKAKASTLKQDKKNFFKTRKFIAPLIGVFAVSCLAQKKVCDVSLKKALTYSSLISVFCGISSASYTNHTFENELKKINEKSRFFLTRKEEFQEKDSFMEKLTAFSDAKKYLISDQETNDTENKLFKKMIDLLNKFNSETNQRNDQIELLKKEIESKNEEVLSLRNDLKLSQQNIDSIKIEIHNLKQDVIVEKNEIELLKSKTLELEKANNESLEKNNKLEAEIVKINEQISTKNKEVEEAKIKLVESESKVVEMEEAFRELNSKYADAEEKLKIKNNEFEEMSKELKTQAEEIRKLEGLLNLRLADQEKKNK